MEYRNAAFNQFGTVDLEINHPEYGWIPFTASPDDSEELGREIFASASPIAASYDPKTTVPARPMVRKSVVQARIIAAGKMPAAYVALTANPVYFARWFAPDHPEVYCDDPDAVALVQALGLDPAVILAP
ncbi:hypothetical protein [Mesorhizobium japonicum]|nr:hypothetical protein [Mesorhizobium japonicum]